MKNTKRYAWILCITLFVIDLAVIIFGFVSASYSHDGEAIGFFLLFTQLPAVPVMGLLSLVSYRLGFGVIPELIGITISGLISWSVIGAYVGAFVGWVVDMVNPGIDTKRKWFIGPILIVTPIVIFLIAKSVYSYSVQKIVKQNDSNDTLYSQAISSLDTSFCNQISTPEQSNVCSAEVLSIKNNDVSYCDRITAKPLRAYQSSCYEAYVKSKNDSSICYRLGSLGYGDMIYSCTQWTTPPKDNNQYIIGKISASNVSTTDWQTYDGTNFTVKYPPNFQVNKQDVNSVGNQGQTVSFTLPPSISVTGMAGNNKSVDLLNGDSDRLGVYTITKSSNTLKSYIDSLGGFVGSTVQQPVLKIDGASATVVTMQGMTRTVHVVFQKGTTIYDIIGGGSDLDFYYGALFASFLQSFKSI